jgi:hypothetical protein
LDGVALVGKLCTELLDAEAKLNNIGLGLEIEYAKNARLKDSALSRNKDSKKKRKRMTG